MIKNINTFFDKLEDKIRGKLSEWPIIYAIIASIGIVLLWRGIWMIADTIPFLNGFVSALIGIAVLLFIGIFVSAFIGNGIILTGLRKEKKITEKTKDEIEDEIANEKEVFGDVQKTMARIEHDIESLMQK